jgi:hypothetical protein
MNSSHIPYQAQLSRINDLRRQAAAFRLAHEANAGQGAGEAMVLLRWLKRRRPRVHVARPEAASPAR